MLNQVVKHFFDLGFYPAADDDFHLGPPNLKLFILRTLWELLVYLLLSIGILCREMLRFEPLRLDISLLSWPTTAAAFVVGSIPFPTIMRRLTKRKPKGGVSHVLVPFAYGLSFDYVVYFIKHSVR